MFQKLTLIGRLGRDPEVKTLQSGISLTQFSLAVSKKNKNGKEKIEWFNCNAWNNLAEVCRDYLKKGSLVFVEGEIETQKYTDKDGVEKTAQSVNIFTIKMLTPKQQDGQQSPPPRQAPATNQRAATPANPYGDMGSSYQDELPF